MSDRQTLNLFADTNLFIQCPPLENLNWKLLDIGGCDAIAVIVSRPVQREIDNQKGKSGTRVGSKARAVAALFRQIILSQAEHVVRDADPRVTVRIDPHIRPDPDLKDKLDYSQRDDELVGTVASFVKEKPDAPCALLTHDTGPMASAQALHLPFKPIPDDWLLAPETNEQEKKISKLEDEVRRLTRNAPSFDVLCVGNDDERIARLELTLSRYSPLSDGDVALLLSRLRERFPITTDFGSREPAERPSQTRFLMSGFKELYEPPEQKMIDEYTTKTYPDWLTACEKQLRELHDALQQREEAPACHFSARNRGTRPANDALISIEPQGHFDVSRLARDDADDRRLHLPRPPKAPAGRWVSELFSGRAFSDLDELRRFAPQSYLLNPPDDFGPLRPPQHDPNAFYYKSVTHKCGDALQLTCDQWRHGVDAHIFSAEIIVPPDASEVAGAIRFRIDAANLPDAAALVVPLRVKVISADTLGIARNLVDSLE